MTLHRMLIRRKLEFLIPLFLPESFGHPAFSSALPSVLSVSLVLMNVHLSANTHATALLVKITSVLPNGHCPKMKDVV